MKTYLDPKESSIDARVQLFEKSIWRDYAPFENQNCLSNTCTGTRTFKMADVRFHRPPIFIASAVRVSQLCHAILPYHSTWWPPRVLISVHLTRKGAPQTTGGPWRRFRCPSSRLHPRLGCRFLFGALFSEGISGGSGPGRVIRLKTKGSLLPCASKYRVSTRSNPALAYTCRIRASWALALGCVRIGVRPSWFWPVARMTARMTSPSRMARCSGLISRATTPSPRA
jgi:hypothetical protein